MNNSNILSQSVTILTFRTLKETLYRWKEKLRDFIVYSLVQTLQGCQDRELHGKSPGHRTGKSESTVQEPSSVFHLPVWSPVPSIQHITPGCLLQLRQENEGESFNSYEQLLNIVIFYPSEPKTMC